MERDLKKMALQEGLTREELVERALMDRCTRGLPYQQQHLHVYPYQHRYQHVYPCPYSALVDRHGGRGDKIGKRARLLGSVCHTRCVHDLWMVYG